MIDTEISGDADNIFSWATWLSGGLQAGLDDSSNLTVQGRKVARDGWEGEGGTSYLEFNRVVVSATDEHEQRVARAAQVLVDLATQLTAAEAKMTALRARASRGGLAVTGMTIKDPGPAPGGTFEPGSAEDLAHQDAVDRVTLYKALARDAATVRTDYTTWVETKLPAAVVDAEDHDDLRRLVTFLKNHYPSLIQMVGAGLLGLSRVLARKQAEFRRLGRNSGNPRIRGQHKTPAGQQKASDLKRRSKFLKGLGRLLSKAGLPLTLGMGVYEGVTTGDWVRPTLVIAGGLLAGAGIAFVAPVATPPLLVALAVGVTTIVGSAIIGHLYDKFEVREKVDNAAGWTRDRLDEAGDWVQGKLGDARDSLESKWEAIKAW